MIVLMITWARNNKITKERQEMMHKRKFNPAELMVVNSLSRKELMYLMMFCGIRALNEVPVTALTDDELKMAYVLWRAEGQEERYGKRRHARRMIRKVIALWKEVIEGNVI